MRRPPPPSWAQLDLLSRNLHRLLDDGAAIEPPRGLAQRTIERVERRRRWASVRDLAPARPGFRLQDLAVAAGIFVAGLLTLIPTVWRSQLSAQTTHCAENLHQLGVAMIKYATTHNTFPYTSLDDPAPYTVQLHDQGLLDNPALVHCPGVGLNSAPGGLVPSDYAYNIGYCEGESPCPLPANLPGCVPLLADRPSFDGHGHALPGNSPNHHHAGQNVLTVGGDVRFIHTPRFGPDDDIFHNRKHLTAPGLDLNDFVLGAPLTRFDGK